jgi:hypothetical protein
VAFLNDVSVWWHILGVLIIVAALALIPPSAPRSACVRVKGSLGSTCPFLHGDVHKPAGPRCTQARAQFQAVLVPAHHRSAGDGVDRCADPRSGPVGAEHVGPLDTQPAGEGPFLTIV